MVRQPTKAVRIRPDLYDQLATLATEHRRSIAGETEVALEQYVARELPPSTDPPEEAT
ncbi:MAG: hypothetical protein ABSG43_00360 [Solirubrobacteraceae bacterium]